jgi:hypothetical protein
VLLFPLLLLLFPLLLLLFPLLLLLLLLSAAAGGLLHTLFAGCRDSNPRFCDRRQVCYQ